MNHTHGVCRGGETNRATAGSTWSLGAEARMTVRASRCMAEKLLEHTLDLSLRLVATYYIAVEPLAVLQ